MMIDAIVAWFKNYRTTVFMIIMGLFSALLLFIGFTYFRQLSVFAVVQTMFFVLLTEYILIDKFILKEYDTLKTLFKSPVAVGLALVALAVLFLACTTFV